MENAAWAGISAAHHIAFLIPATHRPQLLTSGQGRHQAVVGHSSLALCPESQSCSEKKVPVISHSSLRVAVDRA